MFAYCCSHVLRRKGRFRPANTWRFLHMEVSHLLKQGKPPQFSCIESQGQACVTDRHCLGISIKRSLKPTSKYFAVVWILSEFSVSGKTCSSMSNGLSFLMIQGVTLKPATQLCFLAPYCTIQISAALNHPFFSYCSCSAVKYPKWSVYSRYPLNTMRKPCCREVRTEDKQLCSLADF